MMKDETAEWGVEEGGEARASGRWVRTGENVWGTRLSRSISTGHGLAQGLRHSVDAAHGGHRAG